jgi:hypothetical protein
MSKTLEAIFDGEVLRPEDKSGLEPNTRYRITIEKAEHADASDETAYPLTALLELATDMGTSDLATRHDLFAHGELE